MKRVAVAVAGLVVFIAASLTVTAQAQRGWTTLFDGKNLDAFNKVGDANWSVVDGVVQADKGMGGYLVTKQPYTDFEIRAEFWVDTPANSGIFIRCDNPQMPGAEACYEVNIFDTRPDPTYGTGAIVNVAKVASPIKAGGKWNTYEITAKGSQLTVVLNGQKTVDVQDSIHAAGPFALQYGSGVIKFRKVYIKPL
jgi:3-keto-disaccharide hydrolase